MFSIFQGSAQDIYIHWLIVGLGIGLLISGLSVFFSCRSFGISMLLKKPADGFFARSYSWFLRWHSYYWVAFWAILILHLMVTITHIGLPNPSLPFYQAHTAVFYTSILNFVLTLVVFSSCKSFVLVSRFLSDKNPLKNAGYARYYRLHPWLWLLLFLSMIAHIIFGVIHAINT